MSDRALSQVITAGDRQGVVASGIASGSTARLAVTRLVLNDFRCYDSLRLEPAPAPVVLTGPNGAGKTNILEALSFFAPGRGMRRARLSEVARHGAGDSWAVAATVMSPRGPVSIGTGTAEGERERRIVRIDGKQADGQAALSRELAVTWLTPEMDRLFLDAAGDRRRFLDRIVCGFEPEHAGRTAAYENAMRQRLRLLRQGRADDAWFGALENTMAEKGVAIAAARRAVVDRLDRACAHAEGPFPQAALTIDGAVEAQLADGPALAVEDALRARLRADRNGDAETGRTAAGPHRSDLRVWYRPKDLPAETVSTGEQKALLISIMLAVARLQTLERGAPPLLLMDEVVAHLDGSRRTGLFDALIGLGVQAWLTGTDTALFDDIRGRAQFLSVADGRITPGNRY